MVQHSPRAARSSPKFQERVGEGWGAGQATPWIEARLTGKFAMVQSPLWRASLSTLLSIVGPTRLLRRGVELLGSPKACLVILPEAVVGTLGLGENAAAADTMASTDTATRLRCAAPILRSGDGRAEFSPIVSFCSLLTIPWRSPTACNNAPSNVCSLPGESREDPTANGAQVFKPQPERWTGERRLD